MKRFISISVIAVMLAVLAGCEREAVPADDRLNVIATIFAPYDFAREITGDMAKVSMLLPPASESHSFEPSPQDILKIKNCDLFIYIGGESDAWVDGILDSMDTGDMKIVALTECVNLVSEEIVEGMEDDGEEDGGEEDQHVWTSPVNAKQIVAELTDALCGADEPNASAYRQNADFYMEKLDKLDETFRAVADDGARKTIVFGDRFPFRYLADEYGLDYFAAFPGCSAESEPSAATVAFLIDKVKTEEIPVVFHVELSNMKMAETISEATGARVLLLHACHNISKEDFQNGVSYLELMEQNANALREALS